MSAKRLDLRLLTFLTMTCKVFSYKVVGASVKGFLFTVYARKQETMRKYNRDSDSKSSDSRKGSLRDASRNGSCVYLASNVQ